VLVVAGVRFEALGINLAVVWFFGMKVSKTWEEFAYQN
jgi:hypothetical protein